MTNFILWALVLVVHFASLFPPLVWSEKPAARTALVVLTSMLGGLIGFGQALSAIL